MRDYTLESLMEQISMVFQNVYLFADTIENNIKFGRPEATHAEVVAAAKEPAVMILSRRFLTVTIRLSVRAELLFPEVKSKGSALQGLC